MEEGARRLWVRSLDLVAATGKVSLDRGITVLHDTNDTILIEVSAMVVMEFSIFPLDRGASVGGYVARCVEIVERSGLDYRLHAMGTNVEGPLDRVLDVLKQCFDELAADCTRISCSAKFDYRKDHTGRLDAKVSSVEQKLGHPVKRA